MIAQYRRQAHRSLGSITFFVFEYATFFEMYFAEKMSAPFKYPQFASFVFCGVVLCSVHSLQRACF